MLKNAKKQEENYQYGDYDEYVKNGVDPKHPEQNANADNENLTEEDKQSFFGF